MAYEKQVWVDGETPLDAAHLNHIEEGIAQAVAAGLTGEAPAIDLLEDGVDQAATAGKLNELITALKERGVVL